MKNRRFITVADGAESQQSPLAIGESPFTANINGVAAQSQQYNPSHLGSRFRIVADGDLRSDAAVSGSQFSSQQFERFEQERNLADEQFYQQENARLEREITGSYRHRGGSMPDDWGNVPQDRGQIASALQAHRASRPPTLQEYLALNPQEQMRRKLRLYNAFLQGAGGGGYDASQAAASNTDEYGLLQSAQDRAYEFTRGAVQGITTPVTAPLSLVPGIGGAVDAVTQYFDQAAPMSASSASGSAAADYATAVGSGAGSVLSMYAGGLAGRAIGSAVGGARAAGVGTQLGGLTAAAGQGVAEGKGIYEDTLIRLSSQRNPDGSPRFSPEEARLMALGASVIGGGASMGVEFIGGRPVLGMIGDASAASRARRIGQTAFGESGTEVAQGNINEASANITAGGVATQGPAEYFKKMGIEAAGGFGGGLVGGTAAALAEPDLSTLADELGIELKDAGSVDSLFRLFSNATKNQPQQQPNPSQPGSASPQPAAPPAPQAQAQPQQPQPQPQQPQPRPQPQPAPQQQAAAVNPPPAPVTMTPSTAANPGTVQPGAGTAAPQKAKPKKKLADTLVSSLISGGIDHLEVRPINGRQAIIALDANGNQIGDVLSDYPANGLAEAQKVVDSANAMLKGKPAKQPKQPNQPKPAPTPEQPAPAQEQAAPAPAPEQPAPAPAPAQEQQVAPPDYGSVEDATPEEGYAYHSTTKENADSIAKEGLITHDPSFGTEDQTVWPDGKSENRSYFSTSPKLSVKFTPSSIKDGAMLRVKRGKNIKTESTGDLYSTKNIPPSEIEYFGSDGKWHPLAAPAPAPAAAPAVAAPPAAPMQAASAAPPKPKSSPKVIKRAKDYATTGEYDVTLSDGQVKQMFWDKESGNWYESSASDWNGGYPFIGFSKADAAAELEKKYVAAPQQAPQKVAAKEVPQKVTVKPVKAKIMREQKPAVQPEVKLPTVRDEDNARADRINAGLKKIGSKLKAKATGADEFELSAPKGGKIKLRVTDRSNIVTPEILAHYLEDPSHQDYVARIAKAMLAADPKLGDATLLIENPGADKAKRVAAGKRLAKILRHQQDISVKVVSEIGKGVAGRGGTEGIVLARELFNAPPGVRDAVISKLAHELLHAALASGQITQAEYDRIVKEYSKDGVWTTGGEERLARDVGAAAEKRQKFNPVLRKIYDFGISLLSMVSESYATQKAIENIVTGKAIQPGDKAKGDRDGAAADNTVSVKDWTSWKIKVPAGDDHGAIRESPDGNLHEFVAGNSKVVKTASVSKGKAAVLAMRASADKLAFFGTEMLTNDQIAKRANKEIVAGLRASYISARALELLGAKPEEVRKKTGWFRNPYDNRWRIESAENGFNITNEFADEIDRAPAWSDSFVPINAPIDKVLGPGTMIPSMLKGPVTVTWRPARLSEMTDAINSKQSTRAVAHLAQRNIEIIGEKAKIRSTLLHELQHFIQWDHDLPNGTSPEEAVKSAQKFKKWLEDPSENVDAEGVKYPWVDDILPVIDLFADNAILAYRATSGEVEAREAAERSVLGKRGIKETPPYSKPALLHKTHPVPMPGKAMVIDSRGGYAVDPHLTRIRSVDEDQLRIDLIAGKKNALLKDAMNEVGLTVKDISTISEETVDDLLSLDDTIEDVTQNVQIDRPDKSHEWMGRADRFRKNVADFMWSTIKAYREVVEDQSVAGSIPPQYDFELLLDLHRDTTAKIGAMFSKGLATIRGQKLQDSVTQRPMTMDWLFGFVRPRKGDESRQDMKDAIALGLAERVTNIHQRRLSALADSQTKLRTAALGLTIARAAWRTHKTKPTAIALAKAIKAFKLANVATRAAARRVKRPIAGINKMPPGVAGPRLREIDVARSLINEFSADPARMARAQEGLRRYRAFADSIMRYAVDGGFITRESAARMRAHRDYYMNLSRLMDENGFEGAGTGKLYQKLKGSERKIINPFVSLLMAADKTIRVTDKNRVMREFIQWGQLDHRFARREKHRGRDTTTIRLKGVESHWVLDKEVREAFDNMGSSEAVMMGHLLNWMSRMSREVITSSPSFWVRNAIRDAIYRPIVSNNKSGFFDALRGWTERDSESFSYLGGSQESFDVPLSRNQYWLKVGDKMKEIATEPNSILSFPGAYSAAEKTSTSALDAIAASRQFSESVGRMAEYRRAYEKAKGELGYNEYNARLYAAREARSLLDFSRIGKRTQQFMKLLYIPFFNASIQGLDRTYRSFKESPHRTSFRVMLRIVLPTLALAALRMIDDEERQEYDSLPADRRDMFWSWRVGGRRVFVPKPFELGVLGSGFERAAEALLTDKSFLEAFDGYFASQSSMIQGRIAKPLGLLGGSVARAGLPISEDLMAGPFKPFVELIANYSFFLDKDIIPVWEEKKAMELRNTDRASYAAKMLSAGVVDPRLIDNFITSMGGGFGQMMRSGSDYFGADDPMAGPRFMDSLIGVTGEAPINRAVQAEKAISTAAFIDDNTAPVRTLKNVLFAASRATSRDEKNTLRRRAIQVANELNSQYDRHGDLIMSFQKLRHQTQQKASIAERALDKAGRRAATKEHRPDIKANEVLDGYWGRITSRRERLMQEKDPLRREKLHEEIDELLQRGMQRAEGVLN